LEIFRHTSRAWFCPFALLPDGIRSLTDAAGYSGATAPEVGLWRLNWIQVPPNRR